MDEPEIERVRIATFTISINFRPRAIEPDVITRRLGVEPTYKWIAGERTRGTLGSLLPYPHRESRWSLITSYYDRREDEIDPWNEMRDPLGPRLNDRLAEFLIPFVLERDFVQTVVADSRDPWIGLGFPGQFHFGFELAPATLAAIIDFGLPLGIEIFPNTAS